MIEITQHLSLSPGQLATLVCQLEVAAAKPGNVHRGADFEDVTLIDFLNSGVALGSAIDGVLVNDDQLIVNSPEKKSNTGRTGQMILSSVQATAAITETNTNLGIVLLICPLARMLQLRTSLAVDQIKNHIAELDAVDAAAIYQSIRIAGAGGMGHAEQMDVNDPKAVPEKLLDAMQAAADRDMIARQYCNGYADIIDFVLPAIERGVDRFGRLDLAIVYAHVKTMADFPDSLIARKLGDTVANQSAAYARRAVEALIPGQQDDEEFWRLVGDLDFWLRCDGHRRNPGTTADLIAAALYIGIANHRIRSPFV